MTKKTKNIVSDFANNDMPAEVQEQFRCWLDEHAGGEAAETALVRETSYTFGKLQAGTEYTVSVVAQAAAEAGEYDSDAAVAQLVTTTRSR